MSRKLAFGNGVLTVENEAQALERADPKQGDKGGDAARAALSLYRLRLGLKLGSESQRRGALMANADKRSAARLAAVQALYQMDVTGNGLKETRNEFESFWIGHEIEGERYKDAEIAFFDDILAGVVSGQGPIDRVIDKTLASGWPLARIDSVMRAILRAGAYELRQRADVPARVSIKEYVDVAGAFFGAEESGMVNAVLDAVARQCRAAEFEPRG